MTRFATVQASSGIPSSGFAGFAKPYVTSVSDPTSYPLAFPKKSTVTGDRETGNEISLSLLFWRARRWTLTTDASATTPGNGTYTFPGGELRDLAFRTTESEIVTSLQGAQGHDFDPSFTNGSFLFLMFANFDQNIWKDGDDWYPWLVFDGNLSNQFDPTPSDPFDPEQFARISFATRIADLDPSLTYIGTITGTFAGFNIPIHYATGTNLGGTVNFTSLDLSPTTFWGWGGKVNTSTGMPIP